MKTQVVLLRAEELVFWFYDSAWFFDKKERVTSDIFKQGLFDVATLNSRLTYRDFEYLNPVFVEVEQTKEEKIPFTNIVACYVRQGGKIDPRVEVVLASRMKCWPDCIHQKVIEWKVDAEVEDAFLGGRHLREMVSEGKQKEDVKGCDEAIKQWIQWIQPGVERPKTRKWICEALKYTRDVKNRDSGVLGGLTDLGLFLKSQAALESTLAFLRNIRKNARDDRAIIEEVRRCKTEKVMHLIVLIFYFMLKDSCIRDSAFDVVLCKNIAQKWIREGFSNEMGVAVWLIGVNVHASNFAKEYDLWWQQTKGRVASEEAFFPEDLEAFELVPEKEIANAPISSESGGIIGEGNVNLEAEVDAQSDKISGKKCEHALGERVNEIKSEECVLERSQDEQASILSAQVKEGNPLGETPVMGVVKDVEVVCEAYSQSEKVETSSALSISENVDSIGLVSDVKSEENSTRMLATAESSVVDSNIVGPSVDTLGKTEGKARRGKGRRQGGGNDSAQSRTRKAGKGATSRTRKASDPRVLEECETSASKTSRPDETIHSEPHQEMMDLKDNG